jgi:hypothetical protein
VRKTAMKESSKTSRKSSPSPPKYTLGFPSKTDKLGKTKGLQRVRVSGGRSKVSDVVTPKRHRDVRVRNPFSPETVNQCVEIILISSPIWTQAIGWLKGWMHFREAREIKINVQGNELVVKGYMRTPQLEKLFQEFQKQIQSAKTNHLKVTLPRGVKRAFPRELTTTKRRKQS